MKPMRSLGLFFAALMLCGAGNPKIEALLREGQFAPPETADKIADRVLALEPKCGDAYSLKGYAKYCARDFPGAIKDCTMALGLHPKDTFYYRTALNYRYHCYIELKDWTKARADCIECLKVEPTMGVAHDAALLCKKTGDSTGSAKYGQLSEDYKNDKRKRMQTMLERAQATHDPAKVDALLQELSAEVRKNADNLGAISLRASCYETKKDYPNACKDLSKLIAERPTFWANYLWRSKIYDKMGNHQKAAEDIKKAKALGYNPAKPPHQSLQGAD